MSECPIPCNLCGGSDVEVIGTRDRDGRPLRTTICKRCGLVWSNPRPGEAEVRRYYSQEYRLDYKGHSTPSLRHIARSGRGALNRYHALAQYLRSGDRVLDAGAGGGEVVYVLRRFGFDATGLEPDEHYARHAREALGVPVDTGFVQDVSFPSGTFDVVTMYHALEHVEDPLAILSRIRSWIAESGVLLVEVPNVEAECVAPGHRFHFAHFYNFSRPTLEALGRKAGFEPVQTTTSPDGGNLISVFRASAGAVPIQSDSEHFARVAGFVQRHSALKYYCSRHPYRGPLGRLRAYVADRLATSGCDTPKQVIDRLIDRSRDQL
ncbi:MAG TPA: class I SAM-dependent methyltransferase [Vicinamibacterales bacterium]|nr:class I SAM-dependent methyltransferase [Vicinamibacterales bacterium]